jgi:hypothetical protein
MNVRSVVSRTFHLISSNLNRKHAHCWRVADIQVINDHDYVPHLVLTQLCRDKRCDVVHIRYLDDVLPLITQTLRELGA